MAPGGLNFGEIQPTITEQPTQKVYHPTINPSDFLFNKIPDISTSWIGNEFDPEYTAPNVMPPAPGWGITPYMLNVFNSAFDHNSWSVKLSRTPFVSSKGNAMTGEHLYINNFYDRGEYDGRLTTKLAEYATVTEVPTPIVAFEGESAKGLHLISPLVFKNDFGEPYTEENIALVVGNSADVPDAGAYTASLIWTVENAPSK